MLRFIFIFTINLITTSISNGQEEPFDHAVADSERVAFENILDSLFVNNNFERIIDVCNQSHPYYLQSACTYNLIGTYYFLGDSTECWKRLNKEIEIILSQTNSNAYSLDNLLAKDYTSYKKFLLNSTAKNYILNKIDSIYLTEPISDKENGMKLLHLLIEDQWIRKTSSLYDHFRQGRRHLLPSQMDSMQAIQAQRDHCTKVFNFYKDKNKFFSKEEVGTSICYRQLMLFFHEQDLTRREFYHKLVVQGVKDSTISIEARANFEAGTEFITLGVDEFFKRRAELEESYKKKYSLADNYRIRLM